MRRGGTRAILPSCRSYSAGRPERRAGVYLVKSESSDKPSVVPDCWSCPKSISPLQTGATLLAVVLLDCGRQLDATRTSDASAWLTVEDSMASLTKTRVVAVVHQVLK